MMTLIVGVYLTSPPICFAIPIMIDSFLFSLKFLLSLLLLSAVAVGAPLPTGCDWVMGPLTSLDVALPCVLLPPPMQKYRSENTQIQKYGRKETNAETDWAMADGLLLPGGLWSKVK